MQHAISSGNTSKRVNLARSGARLVRIDRRDLGLGPAGLAVVRALILAGGTAGAMAAAGADGGEGGGMRCGRGAGGTMGLGRQNLA